MTCHQITTEELTEGGQKYLVEYLKKVGVLM